MIAVNLQWSCPSGCQAAHVLMGRLVREHLQPLFETSLSVTNKKRVTLFDKDKALTDVIGALDKVGKEFTKKRPFSTVSWVDSDQNARSYHKGEIHVDKAIHEDDHDAGEARAGEDRVHPGEGGQQEAP